MDQLAESSRDSHWPSGRPEIEGIAKRRLLADKMIDLKN